MNSPTIRFSNLLNNKAAVFTGIGFLTSVALAHPAFAQRCDTQQFSLPAHVQPGVRYTTSVTETRGWERELVRRDSNLGHWNWSPQMSYHQWVPKTTSKQAVSIATPQTDSHKAFHYMKPIHAAMPEIASVALNQRTNDRVVDRSTSNKLLDRSCNGKQVLSYDNSTNSFVTTCGASVLKAEVYGTIKSR